MEVVESKKHSCHRENLVRLRRIEGQVRGISKMIEEGKYCLDIVGQLRAARMALTSVEANVLRKHMRNCLQEAFDSKDEDMISEKIGEVIEHALKAK